MRHHVLWTFAATLLCTVAPATAARAKSPMDAIAMAIEAYQGSKVWCEYHEIVWASLAQAEVALSETYPKEWDAAQHRAPLELRRYNNIAGAILGASEANCDAAANAVMFGLTYTISIVGFDPVLLEELGRLQKGGRPRSTDEIIQREEVAKAPNRAGDLDTSRELENVRLYFQARGGSELLQAQTLLASYGTYHGKPDGRWGPVTAEAFRQTLQTYIAIGGEDDDWGVNQPEHTSRLIEWVGAAMFANANGTEYPD